MIRAVVEMAVRVVLVVALSYVLVRVGMVVAGDLGDVVAVRI